MWQLPRIPKLRSKTTGTGTLTCTDAALSPLQNEQKSRRFLFLASKVVRYNLDTLDAAGGRLGFLPEEIRERPEMQCLTDVNLSRNQLFNSDHVFGVLSCLRGLK